jgi:sugar lactone lactonase YvrE
MRSPRTSLGCLLFAAFALAACQDGEVPSVTSPPEAAARGAAGAPAADLGSTADLPPHPESAVHDPVADAYLVSNLGENVGPDPFSHLFDTDDNGFISRVELNPDGSVGSVNVRWIAHPDAADGDTEATADVDGITGVTIRDGDLYAVDRDEILVFDLDDPSTSSSIPLPGSGVAASDDLSLPNDVVVGADGRVWLTDTGLAADASRTMTDAVWSWDGSGWTKVAGGPAGESDLGCPNGIDLTGEAGHPLLLTFCSNQVLRITPGRVTTHAAVEAPADGVGRLDGLVRGTDGTLIFSDWRVPQHGLDPEGGVLRWVHPNGRTNEVILDGLTFPADIGFDAMRERVLIPSDGDQALKIVELDG